MRQRKQKSAIPGRSILRRVWYGLAISNRGKGCLLRNVVQVREMQVVQMVRRRRLTVIQAVVFPTNGNFFELSVFSICCSVQYVISKEFPDSFFAG